MNWRNSLPILGLLVGLLIGCSTVAPSRIVSSAPSWDGTNQHSGFVAWTTNGTAIITPHARDRYNALVTRYGTNWSPALVCDSGIFPAAGQYSWAYEIDNEHLAKFATMLRWKKEGK
jgi:hypothetical protein